MIIKTLSYAERNSTWILKDKSIELSTHTSRLPYTFILNAKTLDPKHSVVHDATISIDLYLSVELI